MKLIIDIDEDYYKAICERAERFGRRSCVLTPSQKIIFNGIPLDDFLKRRKEPIDKDVLKSYLKENKH